ncbi:arylsulfatase [Rhodococcus sp. SMB37]|uniref:sulfatase-like hydrolase/transferase n=1 Tax=Rhodococcus sp. SMB37 TaxID=2512213 RepID=UPI0010CEA909|nr:sulfatase-like hydrolase/transferase [Rhodococcus sp. SMB37]TCN46254.1 arylsulfatase [Rhodococcus sp. SMB37]
MFERQLAAGVVPQGTTLTERPSWVPDWDSLTDEERRVYARMHEVCAGFLTHTDAQIGRVVDSLEKLGVLDNTLIFVMSDNGASAEGEVGGTYNEHPSTHNIRDDVSESVALLDDWGGLDGYPHYAWGWAWAGNTPFRLWKRYAWLGGTRVPMIVHWPSGIRDVGGVRDQFAHAIDILPTILDACGVTMPDAVGGVDQLPVDGANLLQSLGDAASPSPRSTQYFEMLGSRSIFADGWKVTTDQHSEVVRALERQWFIEAGRNNVTPLADSLRGRAGAIRSRQYPIPSSLTLYPEGGPVSDDSLPRMAGGGRVLAEVDVPDSEPEGVLFALGDWTGGFAGFVDRGILTVVAATPGGEIRAVANRPLSGGRHILGCAFRLAPNGSLRVEALIDDVVVGAADSNHELPHAWQHGGASLILGHDRGLAVCKGYEPPFAWNGVLHRVTVEATRGRPVMEEDIIRVAMQVD